MTLPLLLALLAGLCLASFLLGSLLAALWFPEAFGDGTKNILKRGKRKRH